MIKVRLSKEKEASTAIFTVKDCDVIVKSIHDDEKKMTIFAGNKQISMTVEEAMLLRSLAMSHVKTSTIHDENMIAFMERPEFNNGDSYEWKQEDNEV